MDLAGAGGDDRTLPAAKRGLDAEGAGIAGGDHADVYKRQHLLRAIPNAGKYLEFSIEGPDYYPWQEGLFLGDPYALSLIHI